MWVTNPADPLRVKFPHFAVQRGELVVRDVLAARVGNGYDAVRRQQVEPCDGPAVRAGHLHKRAALRQQDLCREALAELGAGLDRVRAAVQDAQERVVLDDLLELPVFGEPTPISRGSREACLPMVSIALYTQTTRSYPSVTTRPTSQPSARPSVDQMFEVPAYVVEV
ncbi:hypothetical protein HFP70_35910 [Streptomyces sp. ARC14]